MSGEKKEVMASLVCTRLETTVCSGQMQMSDTEANGFLSLPLYSFSFLVLGKPLGVQESTLSDQWRFFDLV